MYNKFDLSGKVALVVGGHGGIGKAIALGFADDGADVAGPSGRSWPKARQSAAPKAPD